MQLPDNNLGRDCLHHASDTIQLCQAEVSVCAITPFEGTDCVRWSARDLGIALTVLNRSPYKLVRWKATIFLVVTHIHT